METVNPVVIASVIALTGFVLGILNFMFRILGLIREIGKECHTRINDMETRLGRIEGKLQV